jgi:hypothetical protein
MSASPVQAKLNSANARTATGQGSWAPVPAAGAPWRQGASGRTGGLVRLGRAGGKLGAAAAAAAPLWTRGRPAADPDAPRIELLAPALSAPVPSPTRIRLRFEHPAPPAARPAAGDLAKVRYGSLRVDVARRIAEGVAPGRQPKASTCPRPSCRPARTS